MNNQEILSTIHMLEEENLDIRTATIGISLLSCISDDIDETCRKIEKKIYQAGKNLVTEADRIGLKYGVEIVNKRISVTPISLLRPNGKREEYLQIAKTLDAVANRIGVDFIGGYSALLHKGMSEGEVTFLHSIPEAMAVTEKVCASVNVGTTKDGLNMDAVRIMGDVIHEAAELTAEKDSIGCAKLVVFANSVEDNPFMAGAYHGIGMGDVALHIGISGPGVVKFALEKYRDASFEKLSSEIANKAFNITRMGELIGQEIASTLNIPFGTIDLSLAPTPAIGDSVARILEEMGIDYVGGHGTTAALALLNDAVKKGGLMASTHVGGLSGAFIPVSEDEGMIERAREGRLTIDKLEAMTCVCSVGLDMVAVPGHVSPAQLSAMIADEAMVGIINHKTTAVRIIPVVGKEVGDEAYFGGLLGSAPIIPVHENNPEAFIFRGGFIPAPIHSFKN